jgi:hypothetical protein
MASPMSQARETARVKSRKLVHAGGTELYGRLCYWIDTAFHLITVRLIRSTREIMKLIKSDIFGKVRQPASFDDLIKAIHNGRLENSSFITRMWRGQGSIDWPVHSSGYRRVHPNNDRCLASYEVRLLKQATHNGYRFLDGRELSDMELLARLQHHGAATRLVDTSKNALVALWFCCVSEPNKTGALIGIHTDHLGGYEGEPEIRPYKEVVEELEDMDYPMTWEPPSITKRIAAQHSQFLYSSVKNDKRGSLALPKDDDITYIFAIPPSLKEKCLTILQEAYDIRHLTLFPDLDGFGQANSHEKYEFYNNRW